MTMIHFRAVGISLCRFVVTNFTSRFIDFWCHRTRLGVVFKVETSWNIKKSIMQFLFTWINLHILCNRKSDLDFRCRFIQLPDGMEWNIKKKSWKIAFLWLTEMPSRADMQWSFKEHFSYFNFFFSPFDTQCLTYLAVSIFGSFVCSLRLCSRVCNV